MKITASKRDDILRRKAEYLEDYNQRKLKYDEQHSRYNHAYREVLRGVETQVSELLSDVNLDLSIHADTSFDEGIYVEVQDQHLHDKDKSLSWSWEARLTKDGTVKKESSSWSGLNAVSEANIADLEEIVKALKILNSIPWENVLNKVLPKYENYVTESDPRYDRSIPNFDQELLEADIEDAMENGYFIVGSGYKYFSPRATVVYRVISESAKQYTVEEIFASDLGDESRYPDAYRINKDKFFKVIKQPIEVIKE